MNSFKKLALVAAMSSFAFAASAMTQIQDADLSQVSGQDGVSIAANLNVKIGSFVYTDTDSAGGSVSFNNIAIGGVVAATLDIINGATFAATMTAAGIGLPATFYAAGGDVVQIAVPAAITVANPAALLSISTGSIKMGNNSTASFGSMALNQIDLRGTTAWIWAH